MELNGFGWKPIRCIQPELVDLVFRADGDAVALGNNSIISRLPNFFEAATSFMKPFKFISNLSLLSSILKFRGIRFKNHW